MLPSGHRSVLPLNCTIRCRPFRVRPRIMHVHHTGETLRLEGAEPGEHSGGFAITSRETVWSYEDGNNFSPSEKEPD